MNITHQPIWTLLQQHYEANKHVHMRDQFEQHSDRFEQLHERLHGMLYDYSKNCIDEQTLILLAQLADAVDLRTWMDNMRRGDKINISERRAVLHTALRLPEEAEAVYVDGQNIVPQVHQALNRALTFADRINNGQHLSATNQTITDVVNIGIGGSDLGPQMAVQALGAYRQNINVHFVSNVDGAHISQVVASLRPERTLFIVASKSFRTPETLMNAHAARQWFLAAGHSEADVGRHFVAVSSNLEATRAFGILPENVFEMFDWVGGRYSVWSAIGLPVMCAIGSSHFRQFLAGAHTMDEHFFQTEWRHNIPVLHGLIGVWYNNFYQTAGHTVVPYDHGLRRFPAYMQQLDMESNGKQTGRHGETVDCATGPIIWGDEGANCQHAYFQLLHQSQRLISTDFIVPMRSHFPIGHQHEFLVANAFAQAEALMVGKTLAEAEADLAHLSAEARAILAPQKVFPGNQPSTSIVFDELTPFNLGMLLAMYEHKVFVQGIVWGINSFDQWGVEYGKVLAKAILQQLNADESPQRNSSTNALIAFYKDSQTNS